MKKLIPLIVIAILLVIAHTAKAEQYSEPKLKTRILNDTLKKEIRIVIYKYYSSFIVPKDSVDPKTNRIFHFEKQNVLVEEILDTIKIDSLYKGMEQEILNAYFSIKKEITTTKEIDNTKNYYLGFWKETENNIYSVKFVYNTTNKKIYVYESSNKHYSEHLNFNLIIAWIIFILNIVPFKFFDEVRGEKFKWFHIILLLINIVALFFIIFSWSIIILFIMYIINKMIILEKPKVLIKFYVFGIFR